MVFFSKVVLMMWVGVVMIEMTRMSGGREERLQGLCPMTPTGSPLHRHLVTLNSPALLCTVCNTLHKSSDTFPH